MHTPAFLATIVLSSSLALAAANARSYSNIETRFTTLTDAQGRVTGMPTSIPPVVTEFPPAVMASMLSVESGLRTTAPVTTTVAVTTVVSANEPTHTGKSSGGGGGGSAKGPAGTGKVSGAGNGNGKANGKGKGKTNGKGKSGNAHAHAHAHASVHGAHRPGAGQGDATKHGSHGSSSGTSPKSGNKVSSGSKSDDTPNAGAQLQVAGASFLGVAAIAVAML